ncbi:MAG: thiamine pyrophosphate-dependent enzyme, partial [Nitrospinota bacterium]
LKLPLVALIMNDGEYGMISWKQLRQFGRKTGVAFSNPDFIKFSESFGARGYEVGGPEELAPALKEALASSVPAVVSVPVDYSENMRLTERMGKLVCPV